MLHLSSLPLLLWHQHQVWQPLDLRTETKNIGIRNAGFTTRNTRTTTIGTTMKIKLGTGTIPKTTIEITNSRKQVRESSQITGNGDTPIPISSCALRGSKRKNRRLVLMNLIIRVAFVG
jgi:hypothetical protein